MSSREAQDIAYRVAEFGEADPDRLAEAIDRWVDATGDDYESAKGLAGAHGGVIARTLAAKSAWRVADFEREAALVSLDVDHEVGCPGPRPRYRDLGRRVDGRAAGTLECGECGRSLVLVGYRPTQDEGRDVDKPSSPGGPPPGLGLDIEVIRSALRDWAYDWPPTQAELTDYSDRRVRQVLGEAGSTWQDEIDAAEEQRR